MPTGTWKTTGVPQNRVEEVKTGYELDSPITIDVESEGNGLFTVTAVFPGSGETINLHAE